MLAIVGRIISARTSDPANQLNPSVKPIPRKFSRRNGTRIVRPRKPYTTLGMPTKTSIAGRVIERAHGGATSAMKTASPIESGAAMIAATTITPSVPRTKGRMPNWAGVADGDQIGAKMSVSEAPVTVKIWIPFQPMNTSSRPTRRTTSPAAIRVTRRGTSRRAARPCGGRRADAVTARGRSANRRLQRVRAKKRYRKCA